MLQTKPVFDEQTQPARNEAKHADRVPKEILTITFSLPTLLVFAVEMMTIGALVGVAVVSKVSDGVKETVQSPVRQVQTISTATPSPVNAQEGAPKPGDFAVAVHVIDKECHTALGWCAITYQLDVVYNGPAIQQGKSYTVAYRLTGSLAAEEIGTFQLRSGMIDFGPTANRRTVIPLNSYLKAEVTDVTS